MDKGKIEIWLVGAKTPIEIEGNIKDILKQIKITSSGVNDSLMSFTTIEDETVLIFVRHIALIKSVKEA